MKTLKMSLLGLIGTVLMLYSLSSSAQHVIAITGASNQALDGQWVIMPFFDSFQDIPLGGQPWWGDLSDATLFAITLGTADGTPNTVNDQEVGPIFAYGCIGLPCAIVDGAALEETGLLITGALAGAEDVETYAVASRVPEPATLTLLGLGLAGVGLARRRRKN